MVPKSWLQDFRLWVPVQTARVSVCRWLRLSGPHRGQHSGRQRTGVPAAGRTADTLLSCSRETLGSKVTKVLLAEMASLGTLESPATKATRAQRDPKARLGRTGQPGPQGLRASQDFQD